METTLNHVPLETGIPRSPQLLGGAAAEAGVQEELRDQLAEKLFAGDILDGSVVPVTVGDGRPMVGAPARATAVVR